MSTTQRHLQARQKVIEWARSLLQQQFVVIDLETTGMKNAEIVQIGIIDKDENVLMQTLVKPTSPIPPDVTRIHGITDTMVKDAPGFPQVYVALSTHLAGRIAVAYNSAFDEGILKGVCKRHGLPLTRPLRWECAMKQYANFWGMWDSGRQSYKWQSLSAACSQQQIAIENAHSAVGDCLMTLKLIRAITHHQGAD